MPLKYRSSAVVDEAAVGLEVMMEGCRVLLVQVICALVVVDLATAELELDVEYPDMSNRGRVTLTCRDGLRGLAGAVFQKDGVPLTQGQLVTKLSH